MKKLNRIKYFTKALLELRYREFSEDEVNSCANITSAVEKLIAWHNGLPTYREDDEVYIKSKTGNTDMVGKW